MTAREIGICNHYYFKPTVYHAHTQTPVLPPKKVTAIKFTLYDIKTDIPNIYPMGSFLAANGNAAHTSRAGSLLLRCITDS